MTVPPSSGGRTESLMLSFVLAAQIIWTGPKLTPAEAARILAESPGLSNRTSLPTAPIADGPRIIIIPSSPTAGPYGELAPLSPPRPLDPFWQPWPVYSPPYSFYVGDNFFGADRFPRGGAVRPRQDTQRGSIAQPWRQPAGGVRRR